MVCECSYVLVHVRFVVSLLHTTDYTYCIHNVGIPTLVPPTGAPTVLRGFISLTCGQDVIVPTFLGVSALFISCIVFNGTGPFTFNVIKDGVLINDNSFVHSFVSPNETSYGTYTFIASSEKCGHASAVSRILH